MKESKCVHRNADSVYCVAGLCCFSSGMCTGHGPTLGCTANKAQSASFEDWSMHILRSLPGCALRCLWSLGAHSDDKEQNL